MDNNAIEKEIQAKGLNAPRLTPTLIESKVAAEYYMRASSAVGADVPSHTSLECLTLCILVLTNGFTIVGKSACASPENYNQELGNKIARANAIEQIWPLEGYLLKEKLAAVAV
ncbi:hypothetical protein ASC80_01660 [Afipia sp. Root123D2]|uniref:Gp49 family protein n=1 Tax=Afipia sp. Root123D2 TaxID=1736436 RepID=UPI0006FBA574|nr:Gp49 family protein [Afipia sp. Root123D2]KQW22129.1 hypothetical protein ASC80_01660 [Afipia sp. Root123D2]